MGDAERAQALPSASRAEAAGCSRRGEFGTVVRRVEGAVAAAVREIRGCVSAVRGGGGADVAAGEGLAADRAGGSVGGAGDLASSGGCCLILCPGGTAAGGVVHASSRVRSPNPTEVPWAKGATPVLGIRSRRSRYPPQPDDEESGCSTKSGWPESGIARILVYWRGHPSCRHRARRP